MNEPSKTRTAKGLSVEGFWQELKDNTASTYSAPSTVDANETSAVNAHALHDEAEYHETSEPRDSWESRLDDWLDSL